MQIHLANPRGFCAGVDRAITIVERALEMFEPPIYVRHEVVHNKFVVDGLRERGALFVDELHEVPDDSIVIFFCSWRIASGKKGSGKSRSKGIRCYLPVSYESTYGSNPC